MAIHSQRDLPSAYHRSVRPYLAETPDARKISELILSHFKPVKGSTDLYLYNIAGLSSHLALRVDRNGLIVFALYPRNPKVTKLQYRRKRGRNRLAQRPTFLTAPEIWARINGHHNLLLKREEYPRWKQDLEAAADIVEERVSFEIPSVPAFDGNPGSNLNTERWAALETVLGKRLIAPYRKKLYLVWLFYAERWIKTSKKSRTRLPCCIWASDGNVAKTLNLSRDAVRRVIVDLDRLGLIQAAMTVPSGEATKRDMYAYLPGTGLPPREPTRRFDINGRHTLACMRDFVRHCVVNSRQPAINGPGRLCTDSRLTANELPHIKGIARDSRCLSGKVS
jgi:hypothetical protein